MTRDAEILGRLAHLRWDGSRGTSYCPVHEADGTRHHPSLSIGVGRDGRLLLHCFAGCSHAAIVAALGVELADLRTAGRPPTVDTERIALADVEAARQYVAGCVERLRGGAGEHALGYLAGRFGLGRALAAELRLGYDPGAATVERPSLCGPSFRVPRVVVPLIVGDSFTGFQARSIGLSRRRWVGPRGSGWGRVGVLALERPGVVVLAEGPSDALAAVGAGFPAAFVRGAGLCSSAKSTRRTLAPLLGELHGRRVLVAGDGDDAGRGFTATATSFLRSVGIDARTCDPGDGLDLAAIRQRQGADALRGLLEEDGRA